MTLFAIATILPVALIGAAALAGGIWPWAALFYMTVFTALLDRYMPRLLPEATDGAEFPSGKILSVVLGGLHFTLLVTLLAAVSRGDVGLADRVVTLVAGGLWFGQVAHPNAHELIHNDARAARRLGRAIYASLLMGHHASAHLLVHHVHVGTGSDPNSAPEGLGFYRFCSRAWGGSFGAGLRAENALRARAQTPPPVWSHPYLGYGLIAAVVLAASLLLAGPAGLAACLFLALHAQMQILLSDYVQHYGLRRAVRDGGKPEPVGDAHSWNSPHWFSSALMVNAPRHSDHHLHPDRPYPALRLRGTMPILPHTLPVMGAIALYPPLWRRIMRRALARLPGRA
ncbi:alkane 1-monooxygenase [Marimonas arenosa]|uniref:Alkane 1-monooxygenase n=2 Tax=Marimonas arenosa TaxID=1795305 RepID=A0AAE3WFC9_9RHOB|nr:alkane 1-monooxygenase [Marimonas arenosa]